MSEGMSRRGWLGAVVAALLGRWLPVPEGLAGEAAPPPPAPPVSIDVPLTRATYCYDGCSGLAVLGGGSRTVVYDVTGQAVRLGDGTGRGDAG
jgi:hypothetical protein